MIRLIGELDDAETQRDLLSGLLAFTDKVIGKRDSEAIRRMLVMTKVEQIIYREKMDAVQDAVRDAEDKEQKKIAFNMLNGGVSVKNVVNWTGLSHSAVEELARQIQTMDNVTI